MPVAQLAKHAESSALYGRSYSCTSKFFRLDGLLLFCIIMGLRSVSSTINRGCDAIDHTNSIRTGMNFIGKAFKQAIN